MADKVAIRMRRYRQRQRAGRMVVKIELWAELVDALEVGGFAPPAGIVSREDAGEALIAMLRRWESAMDRTRPESSGTVTRNVAAAENVVDDTNRSEAVSRDGHHEIDARS